MPLKGNFWSLTGLQICLNFEYTILSSKMSSIQVHSHGMDKLWEVMNTPKPFLVHGSNVQQFIVFIHDTRQV